jgi:hypothetical protein
MWWRSHLRGTFVLGDAIVEQQPLYHLINQNKLVGFFGIESTAAPGPQITLFFLFTTMIKQIYGNQFV